MFADGLHLPTGLELGDGGVYVAQQPNLMFLKDTDGDDHADQQRDRPARASTSADSHHADARVHLGPGRSLCIRQEGTFHSRKSKRPTARSGCTTPAVFRFEPLTAKFDIFIAYGFANPWGHYFDRWGQNFVADASGGANYFGTAFSAARSTIRTSTGACSSF